MNDRPEDPLRATEDGRPAPTEPAADAVATGANGHVEVELKYEVASATAERYLSSEAVGRFRSAGAVRSTQVEDRYVDSPDWALARAGLAARLRRTAKGTRINLKTHGGATQRIGLHRREEIEAPTENAQLPVAWPPSPARSIVLELCGDAALVELVTVRQLRRVRPLASDVARAELSADAVEVIADGRVLERFEELEVELKDGDESALDELAAALRADAALRPATSSKFDRAVRAVLVALPTMRDELQARWLSAPRPILRGAESSGGAGGRRKARMRGRPQAERAGVTGSDRERERAMEARKGEESRAVPARQATDGVQTEPGGELELEPSPPIDAAPEADAAAEAAAAEAAAPPERDQPKRRGTRIPAIGRSPGILPDDPLPDAGRKVLRYNFARMLQKEHGTRSGKDPEDLHDMRVATRRMRAAYRIFADAYRPERTRRMRRRLRTVAARLGTVRDLDVLLGGAEAYQAGLPPDEAPGLNPLLEVWRRQRDAARRMLIDELDSDGYRHFVEEMDVFVTAAGAAAAAVTTPTVPHRVRDRAPSRIWDAYEQVRAFEPVLPWADVETLHELRIAGKWLRYTLEFFQEALGQDAPMLVARVTAMQDYLGALHDADVAAKLARDMLLAHAGHLTQAETNVTGAYLHSREREVARRKRGVQSVWRAVTGATFRRALGRATAAL